MCSVTGNQKAEREKKNVKNFVDSMAPFYFTAKCLGFSAYFIGDCMPTKRNRTLIDGSVVCLNIGLHVFALHFSFAHMEDVPKDGFIIVDVGTNVTFFAHMIWTMFSMVLLLVMRERIHAAVYKFRCIDIWVNCVIICERNNI